MKDETNLISESPMQQQKMVVGIRTTFKPDDMKQKIVEALRNTRGLYVVGEPH